MTSFLICYYQIPEMRFTTLITKSMRGTFNNVFYFYLHVEGTYASLKLMKIWIQTRIGGDGHTMLNLKFVNVNNFTDESLKNWAKYRLGWHLHNVHVWGYFIKLYKPYKIRQSINLIFLELNHFFFLHFNLNLSNITVVVYLLARCKSWISLNLVNGLCLSLPTNIYWAFNN